MNVNYVGNGSHGACVNYLMLASLHCTLVTACMDIINLKTLRTGQWCRSQWPRGLRLGSAAARLLRSWVRIPPGAWKFVCCECCVLSGRGLSVDLITRPQESYRLWCVIVCDLETSRKRRPWPTERLSCQKKLDSGCNLNCSVIEELKQSPCSQYRNLENHKVHLKKDSHSSKRNSNKDFFPKSKCECQSFMLSIRESSIRYS